MTRAGPALLVVLVLLVVLPALGGGFAQARRAGRRGAFPPAQGGPIGSGCAGFGFGDAQGT